MMSLKPSAFRHQVVYGSPDQILVYNHALLLFGQHQQKGNNKVVLFMADIDEFLVPKVINIRGSRRQAAAGHYGLYSPEPMHL